MADGVNQGPVLLVAQPIGANSMVSACPGLRTIPSHQLPAIQCDPAKDCPYRVQDELLAEPGRSVAANPVGGEISSGLCATR